MWESELIPVSDDSQNWQDSCTEAREGSFPCSFKSFLFVLLSDFMRYWVGGKCGRARIRESEAGKGGKEIWYQNQRKEKEEEEKEEEEEKVEEYSDSRNRNT